MKVVKDGVNGSPESWQASVTCEAKDKYDSQGCGAVMEIVTKDMFLMYWEGTHSTHYYTAVRCPQCHKYNRVKDVPQPIVDKIHSPRNKKKAIFDGFSDSIL